MCQFKNNNSIDLENQLIGYVMPSFEIILSTLFIVDLMSESRCPCSMNLAFSRRREADVEYLLLGESPGDYEARY